MKKLFYTLFILVLFLFIFIVGFNAYLNLRYTNHIYTQLKNVPQSQIALILGTSVLKNKKPSALLKERLNRAVELYKNNKVNKILLSGDNTKKYYDEVNVMKNYLLHKNILAKDIFLDHNGIRTFDSIYRAKYIFDVKKVIMVSQKFHLPRVLYFAKSFGLDAVGYSADSGLAKVKTKILIREYMASFLAFWDVNILNKKPKFMGKRYNLNQNGKLTWTKEN